MAQASAEKFEHTGPAEKERVASVPQREQLAERRSRLSQKEKEQSRRPTAPDHEGEGSQGERELDLGDRRIRVRARRGKGGLHSDRGQIPRRGRANKKSLPRTSRTKHERVSGRQSSPGRSAVLVSLQVWPNLK